MQEIEIELTATHRIELVEFEKPISKIQMETSRSKCKDVLLEVIDQSGQAKGKPLSKFGPEVKGREICKLRFMMNDFSIQPVTITLRVK